MRKEFDNPEEAAWAAEWQAAYEEELNSGTENPIGNLLAYIRFESHRAYGRKRKSSKIIELVGERGGTSWYEVKRGEFPIQLQRLVEMELDTDEYHLVLDWLRLHGRP